MIILLIAIVIGLLPASIAAAKGRSFVLWWIYGAALFIIALPHAIFAKSANRLIDSQQAAAGNVQCPTCAEWIRPEAKLCRYCKTALSAFFAMMLWNLQLASLKPAFAQSPTSQTVPEAPSRLEYLPNQIKDPVILFGLAHKIQSDIVLKDVRSCFSLENCETWQSALRIIPSTRLIAAIRDCNQFATIKNEFDLRDLDTKMVREVQSAATTAPSAFKSTISAQPGSYDFQREGFSLRWQDTQVLFSGPKTCRGQPILEAQDRYPSQFHIVFDPKGFPDFLRVDPQKARSWLEQGGLTLHAQVRVQLSSVDVGHFKDGRSSWLFSGPTTITGLSWSSSAGELEQVSVAAPSRLPKVVETAESPPRLVVGIARIVKSDVNVRVTPSRDAPIALVLNPNKFVSVSAKSPDGLWSRVSVDGKDVGWILDSAFVKNSMSEEEAGAISEGDMFKNIEPPKN